MMHAALQQIKRRGGHAAVLETGECLASVAVLMKG